MPNHAASLGGFVSAGAAGKVKWKVAPRPPSPVAQIRPPCDSTIDLLIAKPMLLPCGFVVKNASNICSALPSGRPGPETARLSDGSGHLEVLADEHVVRPTDLDHVDGV